VQKKHFRTIVTTGIILALLLAIVPATGLYDTGGKTYGKYMDDRKGKGMHEIERIDIVKTFTGMQNNALMFQVPAMAIQGKEDDGVASVAFATPLRGGYNLAADAGFVSLRGADRADITVRPKSEATLNVAGASMVTTLMDVKVLSSDREAKVLECNTSTLQNPVNTYQAPGTYSVTLTVNADSTSDTTTGQITVMPPTPGSAAKMSR
jgi:hypothetical protein